MDLLKLKAACSLSVFTTTLALSTGAHAQDAPPPPEQDTESATGVSLVSGAYSTSASDLTIGQGEFPQSLTLTREYSSSLNKGHGLNDGIRGWGWATNVNIYITVGELGGGDYPPDEPPVQNQRYPWRYGIVSGTGTLSSFVEQDPLTDPIIGPNYQGPFGGWDGYDPSSLARVGDDLIYTTADKTKYIFEGGSRQTFLDNVPTFITRLEAADGTVLTFNGSLGAKSIFSNRGLALVFEFDTDGKTWKKACAVNLAKHYITPTSNCPSGVPSVTYNHGALQSGFRKLLSVTDLVGNQTSYEYTSDDQLECIKLPGQSTCQVKNFYSNCLPVPNEPADYSMNSYQQVYRQDLITGETVTYDFDLQRYCPLKPPGSGTGYSAPYSDTVTMTYSDGSTKSVKATYDGLPLEITDGLGRKTTMQHGIENFANRPIKLTEVKAPEGNRWQYDYHGSGQIENTTILPKTGSGSQVWQTIYGGASVCYQPTATIDAKGNRTDIEYSTTHCGILKRTLPADSNGVRPQTRYFYAQKYAWVKNSSGSYTRESTPVWVMTSEEFCRTTAASGNGCAGGSSDEVVTTYEYQSGSSTKGSNVWRIGTAITADGQTLRTCYGLDEFGRQISETQPKAGLTSCPT